MTWGEKFSASEIDDAFGEFKIDGGMIDGAHLKSIMVAKKEGEDVQEWPSQTERERAGIL